MKKLVLIIACLLASVGTTLAQDIYTAGSFLWNNKSSAGVWKNQEFIFEELSTLDYSYSAGDVLVHNGDVYWILNEYTDDNQRHRGYLYKNHVRLSCGTASYLNSLFDDGEHVYAAGYYDTSNGPQGVLLRDDNTSWLYTFDNPWSFAAAGAVYNNDVYVGGTVLYTSNGLFPKYYARIWKNGQELFTIKGTDVHLYDMDIYNGRVYSIVHDGHTRVYMDDKLLYTLDSDDANVYYTDYWDIKVDAGDVYVSGLYGDGYMAVYKNGELYYLDSEVGRINALTANSKGLFFAGKTSNDKVFIFKNNESIPVASNCKNIYGIYVEDECDGEIRTLPFTDSFETEKTDWSCWTISNNLGGIGWERWDGDAIVADGNYCARALWSYGATESWLVSPQLFLQPGRHNTSLAFEHRDYTNGSNPLANVKEVLISTTDTNPQSFARLWSSTTATLTSWEDVKIDLKSYQGQAVYIAFKYSGTMAYNWLIDNVRVTETWRPGAIQNVPYSETFESEPGYSWYILDNDHSGNGSYWQNDYDNLCATHPWGPSGVEQEGWLFTPGIHLQSGKQYIMRFSSMLVLPGNGGGDCGELWITDNEDMNKVPDPAHYEYFETIGGTSYAWTENSVDLSRFAGKDIRIAFKLQGTSHEWRLDNFKVEETSAPTYNVTVIVSPAEAGTVEGAGPVVGGATCSLKAIPNEGFAFDKWNDGVTDNPRVITVTENITLTAYFKNIGINENQEPKLTLSPNPAKNSFRIKGIEAECPLFIYNSLGMLVETVTVNAEQEISVSDLAPGLYLVRCGTQTIRLVKE